MHSPAYCVIESELNKRDEVVDNDKIKVYKNEYEMYHISHGRK